MSEPQPNPSPSGDFTGLPSDLQFLSDPDPMAILDRLCEPEAVQRLDLYARVDRLVADQGVLVSHFRLLEKWVAQIALFGFEGGESLDPWLERRGREALEALLSEQHLEEVERVPVARSRDFEFYQVLANALGVAERSARRLCLAIHALPLRTRRIFRALTLDARTVVETASLFACSEDEIGQQLHQAFEAIQDLLDGEGAADPTSPGDST